MGIIPSISFVAFWFWRYFAEHHDTFAARATELLQIEDISGAAMSIRLATFPDF